MNETKKKKNERFITTSYAIHNNGTVYVQIRKLIIIFITHYVCTLVLHLAIPYTMRKLPDKCFYLISTFIFDEKKKIMWKSMETNECLCFIYFFALFDTHCILALTLSLHENTIPYILYFYIGYKHALGNRIEIKSNWFCAIIKKTCVKQWIFKASARNNLV